MCTITWPGTTQLRVTAPAWIGRKGQSSTPSTHTWRVKATGLSTLVNTWISMEQKRLVAQNTSHQVGINGMAWWGIPGITTTHCLSTVCQRNTKQITRWTIWQMYWYVKDTELLYGQSAFNTATNKVDLAAKTSLAAARLQLDFTQTSSPDRRCD